jgi:phenylacetate-CoA ligase
MRLDFSALPLKNRAFSDRPMLFLDEEPRNFLSTLLDLSAIETGSRVARENWQQKQLQNLLIHAARRSTFWKRRIGARNIDGIRLADLPVQTRFDVTEQFTSEGSLIPAGGPVRTKKRSTSGSSGTPVEFFVTDHNSHYNVARSTAQYFMEGRDISLNRTQTHPDKISGKIGFTVERTGPWLGPLATLFHAGVNKRIEYFHPNLDALCRELKRDKIGYLIVQPRLLELILQHVEIEFLKQAGTAMVIPRAEPLDPALRKLLDSADIPIRGNYSSEEVGMIATECESVPGMFHVATSNVIVETVGEESIQLNGRPVRRVLVTHLHSYATPFVRYDLGDVANLESHCLCGHDGPVISSIYGRTKSLLKHADGRISLFSLRGEHLAAIVQFAEYKIRQVNLKTLVVEIGGRHSLTPEEVQAITELVQSHAGDEFEVHVKSVAQIDWGRSTKKLGFCNEVL